ncbi:hypothetical protein [Chitinimonas sp. BJB300]|uniref:hypothetical protein n=1 Tax=Chitinimonas sp. BJB300 TaxID=1559339 RepID=UPI000C0F6ADA|nr:hypothetical protein [Chitinimonas sp. BJB300]PHV10957.1 hypothetical protein CSQ89_13420 [Chitinimonas sp. BJB300]TSJ89892.1 hypothetical protein FG002_006720 [Chitinimonas sp. BJB300]
MFDCLDTTAYSADNASITPVPESLPLTPTALQLARLYPGRSWLCLWPRPGYETQLAKAREVALYLDAEVKKQEDGSLLILDLTLNETLAISQRFGCVLASEALISGASR